jgi:antitoxin component YwqK of YwqJK toxin-antitoxin module
MAQQARYRNKAQLLICIGILLFAGYLIVQHKFIPDVWVNVNDSHLSRTNGYLFYDNKPFSGWLFLNFDNGNRERQTPYYKGKEEGIMKGCYADKSLEQERLFVNGNKEGTHKSWWPNGNPKFEYQFKDDEHNGTAKEWFSDGKMYRSFHYVNGQEQGLQQLWWADGKVRANYVVKDGQQYGLIGRKFCKNVFKDETVKKSTTAYAATYGLP